MSVWGRTIPLVANPRVHEIAEEIGVESALALRTLKSMGEYVKSASSSISPPVARRLKATLAAEGYGRSPTWALPAEGASALTRLPAGVPSLARVISGRQIGSRRWRTIVRRAVDSRTFLYLGPVAAKELLARSEATVDWKRLLAPAGFLVIELAREEVLVVGWSPNDQRRLELVLLQVTQAGMTLREYGRESDAVRAAALLARVPYVIPERDSATRIGHKGSTGVAALPRNRYPEEGDVRVVYLSRRQGSETREGAPRLGSWNVRGHWRNQWYPSRNENARIWIDEHSAGRGESAPRKHDLVYAVLG